MIALCFAVVLVALAVVGMAAVAGVVADVLRFRAAEREDPGE
jgi:hypothetical protein